MIFKEQIENQQLEIAKLNQEISSLTGQASVTDEQWQTHLVDVQKKFKAEQKILNSKLERSEGQIRELRSALAEKTEEISKMACQVDLEKTKRLDVEIDAQKNFEKHKNFKEVKEIEISELKAAHETLKTKSKKLLLSQKQLLTENKSLKSQLEGLSSNYKEWPH